MFNFFLSFAGSWIMSHCPCDLGIAIPRTLCFCLSKIFSDLFSFLLLNVLGFQNFSDSSHLVVALLSPYFTSTMFLSPLNILYAHLKDHKWTELLEGGEKLPLSFSIRSMSLFEHMVSITGPLFPVSASFLWKIPCPPLLL